MITTKYLIKFFVIILIPLVLLSAWLDSWLVGETSLLNYVVICFWELLILFFGFTWGFIAGNKSSQKEEKEK